MRIRAAPGVAATPVGHIALDLAAEDVLLTRLRVDDPA